MNKLPKIINPCPIEEAIFEIRYSSKIPNDARFGMLYGAIGNLFENNPIALPILQLPEPVRRQDPTLKYKAHHQLVKDSYTLGIGPDVLTFSTAKPYTGWKNWSDFFFSVLNKAFSVDVITQVERIGLRYINVFDHSILDNIKCELNINEKKLVDESTTLRTEIIDGEFTKMLQIGNSISMIRDNQQVTCSVIDIDILCNIDDTKVFFKNYQKIVEIAHTKEKELFFSLLNESFLTKFNPEYGD